MPIPIVKTGPTAGQERSRNNDGAWRRKRSDAGTTREKDDISDSETPNKIQNVVSVVSTIFSVAGGIIKFIRNYKK
jgi:hypothetical protein